MEENKKESWILYMCTFPPRECGIATFTQDLTTAIDNKFNPAIKSKILAMNHKGICADNYPKNVIFQLDDDNIQAYADLAKNINKNDKIKLVNIQHEFGIFGGWYGEYLLNFIEALNKPFVVTFHTVVPDIIEKKDSRKRIVQTIAKKAKKIIVLNRLAINILKNDYDVDESKITVIPHGIHDIPYENSIKEKTKLGYKNKTILTTFGFIRSSKGFEYLIDALPGVVDKFPNVLYLIVGGVHPTKIGKGGITYLKFLKNRVKKLGLQENIKIIDRYVSLEEVLQYLKATDLYLCHTKYGGQIVSGTLAYAMGCGRPVISTPFLHSKEALLPNMGILAKSQNPKSFEKAIIKLLSNPRLMAEMGKNAYKYTRHMTWRNVADSYMEVFSKFLI